MYKACFLKHVAIRIEPNLTTRRRARRVKEQSLESTEIQTSIGMVRVEAGGRDWLSVQTVHDGRPSIFFTMARGDDGWEAPDESIYWGEAGKALAPQALIDELFTLASGWAGVHPKAFERAAADNFDDSIGYIVHDSFDQV
jgi:hypothetical protein